MASGKLPEEGHPGDVASAEPILTPVEASAEDVEEELSDGRGSIEAIEKRRAARLFNDAFSGGPVRTRTIGEARRSRQVETGAVAPHSVGLTGRHVGGSVVGTRIAQYPNGIAIFEVTCRCGRALRRNSSTLRYAIRHGLSVECQQCRKDSGGGVWETASLLRRVADGGPVYTDYET